MNLKGISLFSMVLILAQCAQAHKMGTDHWCLVYTDTHLECFYKDLTGCEKMHTTILDFMKAHPAKIDPPKDGKRVEMVCLQNPDQSEDQKMAPRNESDRWNPERRRTP